jgi:hypothetical protein
MVCKGLVLVRGRRWWNVELDSMPRILAAPYVEIVEGSRARSIGNKEALDEGEALCGEEIVEWKLERWAAARLSLLIEMHKTVSIAKP